MIGHAALKKPPTLLSLGQIKGAGQSIIYSMIGTVFTQSTLQKWNACELVGTTIYCPPFSDTRWLKIDTLTDLTTTFGNTAGTAKWSSCVRAPNGHLYSFPSTAATICKLTIPGEVQTTFGALGATANKTSDCILAPNGFIYGVPYSATVVYKVNPLTDTVTSFGSFPGTTKWYGGVLVGTKIYCVPARATSILVIDTATDTTYQIGSFADTGFVKWGSGTLAPDGNVYFLPYNQAQVLVMRPDESLFTIPVFVGASGVRSALVGTKIFTAPLFVYLSSYDTGNGVYVAVWDMPFQTPANYTSIIKAPNGFLYCPPSTKAQVLKITP